MINIDKSFRWVSKFYFNTTFARLFIALSFGIIVAEYSSISEYIFLAILIVGLFFSIFSTLQGKRLGGWIFVYAWAIFMFGCGGYLLRQTTMPNIDNASMSDNSYVVEIKTPPVKKDRYYRTEAIILHSSDSIINKSLVGSTILLNIESDSLLQTPKLCDKYLLHARIKRPNNQGLGGFDYGKYLMRNGLCGVSYVNNNNLKYLSSAKPKNLISHVYLFKSKLINRFEKIGIVGNQLSILSAILLGEKGTLSSDLKATFSASGASHILVVSGMHVGFIFLVILFILKIFHRKFKLAILFLGLSILWSYALLTGLAPSVVRASFMFSMMLIFRELGEKYRVEHALFFSATILLLCNPNTLFDVGFQLSYLAVASITYFYPLFSKQIKLKSKILKWFAQSIALTVSAQIFTLPIVVYNFNQFPSFFVLSNIVVTFFAPIIFIGGILSLALSYLPYVNLFIGEIMNYAITIFYKVIEFIVALPYSTTNIYLSFIEVVLLYGIIFCAINWIELRDVFAERFKVRLYLGLSVLVFLIVSTFSDIYFSKQQKLIIPDSNYLVVNVFGDTSNLLFTNRSEYACNLLKHTWMKHSVSEPIIITDTTLINNIFLYKNSSYLILRDNIFRYRQNKQNPLNVDCLIIDKGIYPSERLFTEFISPKKVILTGRVWQGYLDMYKSLFEKNNIEYHIIAKKGAFVY